MFARSTVVLQTPTRTKGAGNYQRGPMKLLFEQSEIRDRLRAVAWRFAKRNWEAREFEEDGAVFVWRAEQSAPGQTPSWYVERWRRHLRDVIRSGRSVDARKRSQQAVRLDDPQVDVVSGAQVERALMAREDTFAEASARDLFRELRARLSKFNCSILRMLIEGRTLREVAQRMNISVSSAQARVGSIRDTARRLRI